MAAGVKSLSKTFVWILMGMLIVGLAGFGATSLSGTVRTVAQVGNQTVGVNEYFRELQREIRAFETQSGQSLQMSQAQALGLDQVALARLIALASIDSETQDLGISIGDENLRNDITSIPSFQGIDGQFDAEAYKFAMEQAGVSEAEFEEDLRRETSRTLVQGAIMSGVEMPDTMTDAIMDYVAARRSFTMATLGAGSLTVGLPVASDADLQAYYDANGDTFTLPETKQITYAYLTPEMLLGQVELDEDSVRRLFDERADQFNVAERRLVERLVFPDAATADEARARLDAGSVTFEQLVDERGLTLGDIDLGDQSADDLGSAADAVFAGHINMVVGPVETSLGPAMFRINGVLGERITSFEEAAPALRDELAGARARRLIEAQAESLEDMLAGGATPEELAAETEMELGQIDWTVNSSDGLAAYDAFRSEAARMTKDDFAEIKFLEDGGIFAMQVNDILPPRPEPFEDAKPRVQAAWDADQLSQALRERANEVVTQLAVDGDFTAIGLPTRVENGLTRTAYLDGTPADFMIQVFQMDKGDLRVIGEGDTMFIVRLDDTQPPADTPELTQMRDAIGAQLDQALAQALFEAFARDAQTRARPMLDQRALTAVQNSFQ